MEPFESLYAELELPLWPVDLEDQKKDRAVEETYSVLVIDLEGNVEKAVKSNA